MARCIAPKWPITQLLQVGCKVKTTSRLPQYINQAVVPLQSDSGIVLSVACQISLSCQAAACDTVWGMKLWNRLRRNFSFAAHMPFGWFSQNLFIGEDNLKCEINRAVHSACLLQDVVSPRVKEESTKCSERDGKMAVITSLWGHCMHFVYFLPAWTVFTFCALTVLHCS